jgi:SAM-dependent methyltransferase
VDRREVLLRGIDKEQRGLEIGPWRNPLVPKREGYNAIVLDVFDTERLRTNALSDPPAEQMLSKIEEVDIVGSASRFGEIVESHGLAGTLDYVVSSHNFEHLPDPVRFLQACADALKPRGVLSMAIPDRRTCFDYFRPYSTTADFLGAYFEKRERPTPQQLFEQTSLHSRCHRGAEMLLGFSMSDDPANVRPLETLEEAYEHWRCQLAEGNAEYVDAHCWVFTPAVFELIIRDLNYLGLVELQLVDVIGPNAFEFYVRLTKPTRATARLDPGSFYLQRAKLLHRITNEMGENSIAWFAERTKKGGRKAPESVPEGRRARSWSALKSAFFRNRG